jgi:hypothetical protein
VLLVGRGLGVVRQDLLGLSRGEVVFSGEVEGRVYGAGGSVGVHSCGGA